jgi:MarR family transcriptional regulator, transcriptional regulator for hemolysin
MSRGKLFDDELTKTPVSARTPRVFTEDGLADFGYLLTDVATPYVSHFHRSAREVGMTPLQCRLLDVLSRNEGISQVQLAQLTDTDPMTVTRTLDSIQPGAWITRLPDPDDRRAHRLYLGADAMPILSRMWKIADHSCRQALAVLTRREREQLVNLLERMHGTLLGLEPKKEIRHE